MDPENMTDWQRRQMALVEASKAYGMAYTMNDMGPPYDRGRSPYPFYHAAQLGASILKAAFPDVPIQTVSDLVWDTGEHSPDRLADFVRVAVAEAVDALAEKRNATIEYDPDRGILTGEAKGLTRAEQTRVIEMYTRAPFYDPKWKSAKGGYGTGHTPKVNPKRKSKSKAKVNPKAKSALRKMMKI